MISWYIWKSDKHNYKYTRRNKNYAFCPKNTNFEFNIKEWCKKELCRQKTIIQICNSYATRPFFYSTFEVKLIFDISILCVIEIV